MLPSISAASPNDAVHRMRTPAGAPADGLTPVQRRSMIAAVLVMHAAAVWGLLQVREVRDAVAEAAPMFVDLIAPPAPPTPPAPTPPVQRPLPKRPPLPAALITAAPAPAPAAFVAAPPPELPEPPAPPAPALVQAPVAPPAPPPPPARIIPASAVQYLEPPVLEYPRLSRRLGETGRVMVRVYIDEAGLPRNVQLSQSSGHLRLDDAAVAAVRKARFKPYTEGGRPTPGWASIPIDFELEK
jgi:periplasmic protein TonB